MDEQDERKMRINGELRGTPEVRVFAHDGTALGVMPLAAALRLAMKEGLDLVEVAPDANPPACKLMDYATVAPTDDAAVKTRT